MKAPPGVRMRTITAPITVSDPVLAIVTDDAGNENNIFEAPSLSGNSKGITATATSATDFAPNVASKADVTGDPASSRPLQPRNVAQLQQLEQQRMSSTPVAQVSQTAAEVADTAMILDAGKVGALSIVRFDELPS